MTSETLIQDFEIIQLNLGTGRNALQPKICECGCGQSIRNRMSNARYTKACSDRINAEKRRLFAQKRRKQLKRMLDNEQRNRTTKEGNRSKIQDCVQ